VFDHVTIRVSDLETSRRFYGLAFGTLGYGEPATDGHFFEWNDLSISAARDDRPLTRRLHVGLAARSRELVDEFWTALTEAGFRDDGAPGPRLQYRHDYYGAFVLDPDGNSIEAVHHEGVRTDGWAVQHVWLRVRDLEASRRFYETIAPVVDFTLSSGGFEWASFRGTNGSFTLTRPDATWSVARPLTENGHLAFPARDDAQVNKFHRVALAAGYRDNGPPGERRYHRGYYGAFVLDPDGNNVEAVCHNR
jgi:catechol 2,3-dioxygenase-like lactoylglutathione lyase family enzyme